MREREKADEFEDIGSTLEEQDLMLNWMWDQREIIVPHTHLPSPYHGDLEILG